MKQIQVLGPGCAKCKKLLENVEQAVSELGLDCEVVKVTDINEITRYDVMMTPALTVDGTVKSSGSALSVKKVKEILSGD
ncbi:MAG: thioredoxin family protein [Candidatus Latescibacterota bacterium]|jgi:small redox-active disulfide protein 2